MDRQCMPIEDCSVSAVLSEGVPQLHYPTFSQGSSQDAAFSYTYYPGGTKIPKAIAPNLSTRFYAIEATVNFSEAEGDLQGVLLAHGGCFGGHSFYIYQGKLCYVYNWLGQQQKITCDLPTLSGEVTLKVEFAKEKTIAPPEQELGSSTTGEVKLYINGTEQAVDITRTFSNYTPDFLTQYKHEIPYEFEGAALKKLIVTVTNDVGAINYCDSLSDGTAEADSFDLTSGFEDGYEAYRTEVLAKMKELGLTTRSEVPS